MQFFTKTMFHFYKNARPEYMKSALFWITKLKNSQHIKPLPLEKAPILNKRQPKRDKQKLSARALIRVFTVGVLANLGWKQFEKVAQRLSSQEWIIQTKLKVGADIVYTLGYLEPLY